jgi:Zn-dependent protease with chaperone function
MFALRSLMVGLAFFGVCYCALSLLVVILWHAARLMRCDTLFRSARSLFALRMFPLAASAFVTVIFAVPAFFRLEGGMDEDVGTLIFSLGTLLLFAAGCVRIMAAQLGASRMLSEWLAESKVLKASPLASTLSAKHCAPPLLLYGIREPQVLVSESAVALLSPEELAVALRHEASHLRFRDNLKKLILHGIPFPGMGHLEHAWQEGAEFAADDAAVSSSDEALNLATALIKMCSLAPAQEPPAFTTGLVGLAAMVDRRVHRLVAWKDASLRAREIRWAWFLLLPAVGYGIFTYNHALLLTHRFTEWFIH